MNEHYQTILEGRTVVNPLTGGRTFTAWFRKVRVVHRSGEMHVADRWCKCEPIVVAVSDD